jgi:hypothetical protein
LPQLIIGSSRAAGKVKSSKSWLKSIRAATKQLEQLEIKLTTVQLAHRNRNRTAGEERVVPTIKPSSTSNWLKVICR